MKIGTVVKLKSGSPSMTVRSIENHLCECTWFVYDIHGNLQGGPERHWFPVETLQVAENK